MSIGIYRLISPIHDEGKVVKEINAFIEPIINKLGDIVIEESLVGSWFKHQYNLILIGTGGTENLFKELYDNLLQLHEDDKLDFYLLTTPYNNSFPAALEILHYLRSKNQKVIILHGNSEDIVNQINDINNDCKYNSLVKNLNSINIDQKIGVIGKPSDWLIASNVDYKQALDKFNISIYNIDMNELLATYENYITPMFDNSQLYLELDNDYKKLQQKNFNSFELFKAYKVYYALKTIINKYHLDAITLRCFSMIAPLKTTGCLALSLLNTKHLPAACEGDIPSLMAMLIVKKILNQSVFQVNPASIHNDKMILAHCTIPLDMVESFELDTHFETNQGVAIKGKLKETEITIFKISPDLKKWVSFDTYITTNLDEINLCRTQIEIVINEDQKHYFLNESLGNHHLVILGHHTELLNKYLKA